MPRQTILSTLYILPHPSSFIFPHLPIQTTLQPRTNHHPHHPTGFYTLNHPSTSELILGPFQGKVACQTIAFGRGVCGAAAATKSTQLVPDVEAFSGHIACDGDSKSEIVVPIVVDGKTVAIIDVDCAELNGFDEVDKVWLEKLADLVGKSCDWP